VEVRADWAVSRTKSQRKKEKVWMGCRSSDEKEGRHCDLIADNPRGQMISRPPKRRKKRKGTRGRFFRPAIECNIRLPQEKKKKKETKLNKRREKRERACPSVLSGEGK